MAGMLVLSSFGLVGEVWAPGTHDWEVWKGTLGPAKLRLPPPQRPWNSLPTSTAFLKVIPENPWVAFLKHGHEWAPRAMPS